MNDGQSHPSLRVSEPDISVQKAVLAGKLATLTVKVDALKAAKAQSGKQQQAGPRRRVLYLFAGPPREQDSFKHFAEQDEDFDVDEMDWKIDKHLHNLLDDTVWEETKASAKKGKWQGILSSTPCETMTSAREGERDEPPGAPRGLL